MHFHQFLTEASGGGKIKCVLTKLSSLNMLIKAFWPPLPRLLSRSSISRFSSIVLFSSISRATFEIHSSCSFTPSAWKMFFWSYLYLYQEYTKSLPWNHMFDQQDSDDHLPQVQRLLSLSCCWGLSPASHLFKPNDKFSQAHLHPALLASPEGKCPSLKCLRCGLNDSLV